MADKDLNINVKANTTEVDAATEKVKKLGDAVKNTETKTKDFGNSVKIEYDKAGQATDVLVDKELSLTKQIRAVKAQMEILTATGKAQSQEFTILQRKYNDLGDNLSRNKARSQELFGTLSLLPGPVGAFASQLQGGLDLLKTFSGIKLNDFRNQFKGLGDDIKGILGDIFGVKKAVSEIKAPTTQGTTPEATTASNVTNASAGNAVAGNAAARQQVVDAIKEQTKAAQKLVLVNGELVASNVAYDASTKKAVSQTENMTKASTTAKTAIQSQAVATETLSWASKAATAAVVALEAALVALGIGAIIILFTKFISVMGEFIFKTKETAKAFKEFSEGLALGKEALDNELISIQNFTQDRINILKKSNADASVIRNEEINGIKKQQEAVKRGLKDIDGDVQNALDTYLELKGGLINNMFNKEEAEKAFGLYQTALARQKELTQKNIALNQDIKNKGIENDIATTQEGYSRQLAELDARIQLETDKEETNSTELTNLLAKRADMVIKHDKLQYYQQELLRKENNKKVVAALDEDSRRTEEFLHKIEDIEIAAIENTEKGKEEAELRARTAKMNRDYEALTYDKEFQKLSTDEKNKIYTDLLTASEEDEIKIRETYFLKRLKRIEEQNALEIKAKQQAVENTKAVNDIDLLNAQFNYSNLLKLGKDFYMAKMIDMREAFQINYDNNNLQYQLELEALKKAFADKNLTEEEYKNKVIEVNQKIADNNQQQFERNRQLDRMEIEAKKETAAATIKVGEEMVALLTALGAFSTDWQIAAALADAILGIAKIITATQVAIAEFSASVAWMGPAGAAMATAYAIKQKIAAGIGIAAITVGAIGRINQVKASANKSSATEGGGTSAPQANYGKNYGDGGMINGPLHAQGGVAINAEGGEAVMTRGAVTMFKPLLSMMNQAGGGTSFMPNLTTTSFDAPKTASPSEENKPMVVKTYVVSSELTTDQQRQARLKDLSTL